MPDIIKRTKVFLQRQGCYKFIINELKKAIWKEHLSLDSVTWCA